MRKTMDAEMVKKSMLRGQCFPASQGSPRRSILHNEHGWAIPVLPGTTKEDVGNAGFDPNKIVVYYDEARTVGTDVKFQPTAFALQTIDPASTS
jgi:hypothetical protein